MMGIEVRAKAIIADMALVADVKAVTSASRLTEDLALDSLDMVELIMALEEDFGFEASDEDWAWINQPGATVGQLVEFITTRAAS
jgi:acyl carrier protein